MNSANASAVKQKKKSKKKIDGTLRLLVYTKELTKSSIYSSSYISVLVSKVFYKKGEKNTGNAIWKSIRGKNSEQVAKRFCCFSVKHITAP